MFSRPVIWTAFSLYLVFAIVASFIPAPLIIETLRIVLVSVSAAVVVAYAAPAFEALIDRRKPDLVAQLTLGIALGWLATSVQASWSWLWRMAGQPAWMANTDVSAFLSYSLILAAMLHITAPGAIDGNIPRRNMISLGVAVGIGVFLMFLVALVSPDVSGIVEFIRPFLDEKGAILHRIAPFDTFSG